jgi:hypothetical protein
MIIDRPRYGLVVLAGHGVKARGTVVKGMPSNMESLESSTWRRIFIKTP